jgi:NHL repeat
MRVENMHAGDACGGLQDFLRRVRLTGGERSSFTVLAFAVIGALGWSLIGPHARAQAPPVTTVSLSYIGAWGMHGDGPGQLDQPTCIATDTLGNAYIADSGSHFIHKFDPGGTPLLSFQDPSLEHPDSITVDRGGAIYVGDSQLHVTFIFFPNGDRYRELRLPSRGGGENALSVAVADDGSIFVLDPAAGRLFPYTPRLRLLQSWQPSANAPNMRIRASAVAAGPNADLYFVAGTRILRFTPRGDFLSQIDSANDLSSEFCVSRNLIFAMGADGRMVHVWSLDGQPKLDIDLSPELGQGNRSAPALAVSPRQELLVLDSPESRVLRYRINF